MKKLLFLLSTALFFAACTNDNSDGPEPEARRTVIVYFNAENNLSSDAQKDLQEIIEGSNYLSSDCNLIAYVDAIEDLDSTTGIRSLPYICKIANGEAKTVLTLDTDASSSSPEIMKLILQWIINKYPAKSLGMTFWGHGTGSMYTNDTLAVSRAYGADSGSNNTSTYKWINIPMMAQTLNSLTKADGSQAHLDFLFFDACLMQSVEVAYEFRNTTDYLIGCCCETPSFGAPYIDVTPLFGESSVEQLSKDIVNTYIDNNKWGTSEDKSDGVCISAVKTSELDNLLSVTKSAIDTISYDSSICPLNLTVAYDNYPTVNSCIFYYLTRLLDGEPIFYDINDVMLHNLSNADYITWKKALDTAVIAKRHPRDITQLTGNIGDWIPYTLVYNSDYTYYFRKFLLTDDTYGGLSMFIPKQSYSKTTSPNMNTAMYKYEWCNNVGWKNKGW